MMLSMYRPHALGIDAATLQNIASMQLTPRQTIISFKFTPVMVAGYHAMYI